MTDPSIVRARIGLEHYASFVEAGEHTFIGDEPISNGGEGKGPTPTQFILSGLATCTVTTLRMYADRKEWPLEEAVIDLSLQSERTDEGMLSLIHSRLFLRGPLTEEQRQRLLEIARKCPVHRMLTQEIRIQTALGDGVDGRGGG